MFKVSTVPQCLRLTDRGLPKWGLFAPIFGKPNVVCCRSFCRVLVCFFHFSVFWDILKRHSVYHSPPPSISLSVTLYIVVRLLVYAFRFSVCRCPLSIMLFPLSVIWLFKVLFVSSAIICVSVVKFSSVYKAI